MSFLTPLQEYTRSRLTQTGDEVERYATEFVLKLLKKRLFSSPEAFAATLRQHEDSLANAKRRTTPSFRANIGILRRQVEQAEEETDNDEELEEATLQGCGCIHLTVYLFKVSCVRSLADRTIICRGDGRRYNDIAVAGQ